MGRLKIGQLARRSGLTVRTLHHYDAIGLLSPRWRTAAGHRLYGSDDVQRLHQIVALRQLGFALEEIGRLLDQDGLTLLQVIERHLERLEQRIRRERELVARLHALAHRLSEGQAPDADDLLKCIEAMMMFEKYYTPEQLETLRRRAEQMGGEALQAGQQEWQNLFARARELAAAGVAPDSPEALELLAWRDRLIEAFTGGDAGIRDSLASMYRQEPGAAEQFGVDTEAMGFLARVGTARSD